MRQTSIESYFLLTLLASSFVLLVLLFIPYLSAFILALSFAVIFAPIHGRIRRLFRRKDGFAAFVSVALILIIGFVPLVFFSRLIVTEVHTAYVSLLEQQEAAGGVVAFLEQLRGQLPPSAAKTIDDLITLLSNDVTKYAQQAGSFFLGGIATAFTNVTRFLLTFFVSVLTLYYFLKDGDKLAGAVVKFIPLNETDSWTVFKRLKKTINSVMRGTLVIAIVQGIIAGVGFVIFGISSPAFWGFVAAFASLLPAVGTTIVTVPAGIYLMITGDLLAGIGLAVWGMLVVGLVDNLLRPYLIERDIQLHSFLVLLSVLGGFRLFGPVGFLAGPLVLSFFFAIFELYSLVVARAADKTPQIPRISG